MSKKKNKKSKNLAADSVNDSGVETQIIETSSVEINVSSTEVQTPNELSLDVIAEDCGASDTVEMLLDESLNENGSETPVEIASESTNELGAESLEALPENTETLQTASEGEIVNTLLITDRTQIRQVLEAIIFAAPKAMSTIRLRNLLNHFNYDSAQMVSVLEEMIEESSSKGFQLIKVAGGYQYRSHPEHSEVLQKLLEDKPARLSASALEVLAIVAYKQPVSRSDIDSVRGVDSGHLMKGLLEKNLVRTLGHAETPGRPLLYGTSSYFLEVFSLGSLDDLPQMDELKRELTAAPEGSSGDSQATNEIDIALGLMPDSSGLAANPQRGAFDQPHEEDVHAADFGMADRAREEVNSLTEAQ